MQNAMTEALVADAVFHLRRVRRAGQGCVPRVIHALIGDKTVRALVCSDIDVPIISSRHCRILDSWSVATLADGETIVEGRAKISITGKPTQFTMTVRLAPIQRFDVLLPSALVVGGSACIAVSTREADLLSSSRATG